MAEAALSTQHSALSTLAGGYLLRPRREIVGIIDGSALRPDAFGKVTRAEAAAVPIVAGRRAHPLGELFEIDGDPGPRLTVVSRAGMGWIHLGAGAAGGELVVEGDAGDLCGMGMAGGTIHVRGSA